MLKSGNQSLITKRNSKTPTEEQKGLNKCIQQEKRKAKRNRKKKRH